MDDDWTSWPDAAKRKLLAELMTRSVHEALNDYAPYPWGTRPTPPTPHSGWIINGGRGIGKTQSMAEYITRHAYGPVCDSRAHGGHKINLVAPTLADAANTISGPSGVHTFDSQARVRVPPEGTIAELGNGVRVRLLGAHTPEDVERLRAAGNSCLVVFDEIAAIRYLTEAVDHALFGLRLGPNPHWVGGSTPKARKEYKNLLAKDNVEVTKGKTSEAFHLPKAVIQAMYLDKGGTRLGRQELEGEIVEDVEGALWTTEMVDMARTTMGINREQLSRIVIGIDPAMTATETSDLTGIVACGRTLKERCYICGQPGPHYVVLKDKSGRYTPNGWASTAIALYHELQADALVPELNGPQDLVKNTIRQIDPAVAVKPVNATRGKFLRAEPVSIVYNKNEVHHITGLDQLQEQQLTYTADVRWSPDRLDAMVHAMTELMAVRAGPRIVVRR